MIGRIVNVCGAGAGRFAKAVYHHYEVGDVIRYRLPCGVCRTVLVTGKKKGALGSSGFWSYWLFGYDSQVVSVIERRG